MKAYDLSVTIALVVAFFLLCGVVVAACVVVSDIPTQDARAAPTISIPEAD